MNLIFFNIKKLNSVQKCDRKVQTSTLFCTVAAQILRPEEANINTKLIKPTTKFSASFSLPYYIIFNSTNTRGCLTPKFVFTMYNIINENSSVFWVDLHEDDHPNKSYHHQYQHNPDPPTAYPLYMIFQSFALNFQSRKIIFCLCCRVLKFLK